MIVLESDHVCMCVAHSCFPTGRVVMCVSELVPTALVSDYGSCSSSRLTSGRSIPNSNFPISQLKRQNNESREERRWELTLRQV